MTAATPKIRVLLADDSLLAREYLKDIIGASPDIEVAAEAADGAEAVKLACSLRPDLIVMDILMPVMGGMEAIERIMDQAPTRILALSSTFDDEEVRLVFAAIEKGALDVMAKPSGGMRRNEEFAETLLAKIRLLARIKVIHHPRGGAPKRIVPVVPRQKMHRVVAVGASTGGPRAVLSILKALPRRFTGSVLIVQHIATGFAEGFANWLAQETSLQVVLAQGGELLREGVAYVAPNDMHMIVANGKIQLSDTPAVHSCRPSVDVLFASVAQGFGAEAVGVLLTGMGKDGAQGLSAIRVQGGHTIVQDEETSTIFGMPKAAIALSAATEILPLGRIAERIMELFAREGGVKDAG